MHKTLETLETLNMDTVEFNPEFLRMIRTIYHEQFKQMSLEYGSYNRRDYFSCDKMLLTSLEGAPQKIKGYFSCNDNNLTSLEGAPQSVSGSFYCENNQLTSLEGAPQSVSGGFYCENNQLTTLAGAPQSVRWGFFCNDNPKLSEAQINHYKEFRTGKHQECLVDGHYMPPERLK